MTTIKTIVILLENNMAVLSEELRRKHWVEQQKMSEDVYIIESLIVLHIEDENSFCLFKKLSSKLRKWSPYYLKGDVIFEHKWWGHLHWLTA